MNDVIRLLTAHRSIRKFTDQPIDQSTVEALVSAGQCAATSSFIQACTVIQVSQGERRERLAEYAGQQPYVASAPVFLVFCADMQRLKLACDMHSAEMLSGYTEQFITTSLDCALFAQNVVIAAESLGLGCTYIGGIRNRIAEVAELLDLPTLVYPVFGLCIGHPAQNPEAKPRLPLSVILKQERYEDAEDQAHIEAYDAHVREYYATRTGGQKVMTWSEQMSGMLVKEARPHMLPFLQSRGFIQR